MKTKAEINGMIAHKIKSPEGRRLLKILVLAVLEKDEADGICDAIDCDQVNISKLVHDRIVDAVERADAKVSLVRG
jgi:hypothetical protein